MMDWPKQYIPRRLRRLLGIFRRRIVLIAELGLIGGIATLIRNRVGAGVAPYPLKPRHANHTLYYRPGSSDLDVFYQIFIDREYAPLCRMREVRLVIDCGANVGYSSTFFLSQFPCCHVIAVEPDSGNFAMLQRNLSAYGSRAELVRAAIWSQTAPLKISRGRYRDGREWTVQVRSCESHEEPDFQGVSITSLLTTSGVTRISLLKMDIEGAEAVVFQENIDWLDRVDVIAIELHDDSIFGRASEVFYTAIGGRGFEISRSGELTICYRRTKLGDAADGRA